MRTTSSIIATWMKVEVGFKPFLLRCFASLRLLVQHNQMLRHGALFSRVRVASTFVTKLSFIKLVLCNAFPFAIVSKLFVPFAVTPRWKFV